MRNLKNEHLKGCCFPAVDAQLDDVGLSFVKTSISAIETRGEL